MDDDTLDAGRGERHLYRGLPIQHLADGTSGNAVEATATLNDTSGRVHFNCIFHATSTRVRSHPLSALASCSLVGLIGSASPHTAPDAQQTSSTLSAITADLRPWCRQINTVMPSSAAESN